ncbi:LINE-1 reverse transcriptase -like protein [Xyrichtys novacula]|uniref:LINE-1 reverse transcriptase -like protein n=1 Tax=Xyrichtys novacula TaxID=13765 RepID=A0AAV1FN71_XYRNO|nr:LINE-1 reverse transcriptase -like protein [Xyrichtys novacula]
MLNSTNVDMQGGGKSLRFTCWNVGGMNGPVKRGRILSHLKHLKTEIAFLQETHLTIKDQSRLKAQWVGQIYHSGFDSRTRGTAILIHKNVHFIKKDIISDPCGRFIMVSGCLFNTPVLLVNIYAPNWDDEAFINKIISLLPDLNSYHLIFGGDTNCTMDQVLDRSSTKKKAISKMAKAISSFMSQVGCVDVWRFKFPDKKIFSFFSKVHKTFTRIDYLFIDKFFLPSVKFVDYSAIVVSDHAPLLLDLDFSNLNKARPPWRLNPILLNDPNFSTFIANKIDEFISNNNSDTVSPSLLWETLKAVIRGDIISYCSKKNKLKKKQLDQLIEGIKKLDNDYSVSPSPETYKERLSLQMQYDLLTTEKTENMLIRSRGLTYEHGEKAGRLLSHQLKKESAARNIPQIKNSDGLCTVIPTEINNTFKTFYSDLYTTRFPVDISDMMSFLGDLQFPILHVEKYETLEQPLSLKEIEDSILAMQNGKAPGPDGYPVEFYKIFSNKLAPLLSKMYTDSLGKGLLPQTLTEASISLILKPDKDPLNCGSYRPISLLNADYKILAKILASRMETVISDMISVDQTGFIRDRHSSSNIRRLLNVILSPASSWTPEMVVSLDAEKAFDMVEWSYLLEVLKKFGFGPRMISLISLLYSAPKASVSTNGMNSQMFTLSRGCRQGCPASPLLFALAIEPLSIALKSAPFYQGIRRWGLEYKVSLYADDLLIYISDPVFSVPKIIQLLNRFGTFSGYRLNFNKSECFPINDLARKIPSNSLPFRTSEIGFKYLGVLIRRSLDDLFRDNILPLVEKLKVDLHRWGLINISLAGRVNCIKMNVLPRFLYLFQALPVFIPRSFFCKLDSLLSSFIWGDKPSRIKREYLQRSRVEGGLALPNFKFYYWAANISKIICWSQHPDLDWCKIEANSCLNTSLLALTTTKLPILPKRHSANPIVVSTLQIWSQFRTFFGLRELSPYSPIYNNHLFAPSITDPSYLTWHRLGLSRLSDLYIDGIFANFRELANKYELPNSHLFRFFQIRDFVKTHNPSFPNKPPSSGMEPILEAPGQLKGLLSFVYKVISSLRATTVDGIRLGWEEEFGEPIADDTWKRAQTLVNGSASCARLSLIQLKVFHRSHYSKAKLARIYPTLDDTCDKCQLSHADLTHMFWACPCIQTYWTDIFRHLSQMFNINLQPSPESAIFGVLPRELTYNRTTQNGIAFLTLLARRKILLEWKSSHAPQSHSWLKDVMAYLKLEKIKFDLRGSPGGFTSSWGPTINYLNNLTTL